ncbi:MULTISPECIES: HEPN domain-containing protein [unclassified Pseudomonas]|uniref:HEPN domain-containing protein n=1 Tax=unclassified Pseudomonas TaxID=196821 RepID=UPI0016034E49|nr:MULTISPECIES: HEPN domain-containing protein [unclassified Pseudomonas]
MNCFLVIKILDDQSFSIPSTMVYGDVEIRSYSADTKQEVDALKISATERGLDFNKYSVCARIATIVECETFIEAIHFADNRFLEVLDFKSTEFSVSNIKTSPIGLIKDLTTGTLTPITKTGFEPSISFIMNPKTIQRFDSTNYVLSLNNELSERYKRSLHWARNSKNETNQQLKIIFLWFSIEALFKEDETDNCVESYIRLFLGFPNGGQLKLISDTIKANLENHKKYKYWQKELKEVVKKIRNFRNDSVHSGFRSVDFRKETLDLFSTVMIYATSRCQAGVMRGLLSEIGLLSEFKKYAVVLFEDNINLINDVHNNIIHSLDHPIKH